MSVFRGWESRTRSFVSLGTRLETGNSKLNSDNDDHSRFQPENWIHTEIKSQLTWHSCPRPGQMPSCEYPTRKIGWAAINGRLRPGECDSGAPSKRVATEASESPSKRQLRWSLEPVTARGHPSTG